MSVGLSTTYELSYPNNYCMVLTSYFLYRYSWSIQGILIRYPPTLFLWPIRSKYPFTFHVLMSQQRSEGFSWNVVRDELIIHNFAARKCRLVPPQSLLQLRIDGCCKTILSLQREPSFVTFHLCHLAYLYLFILTAVATLIMKIFPWFILLKKTALFNNCV